ncbi:MAG: cell division protein SepF [Oscillospiraceae bacterium]|nr:cell division protein SepF [Oscillospiraceae bacterium]
MGLWSNIKNIMTIPEEDEFEEEFEAVEETNERNADVEEASVKRESTPRIFQSNKAKTVPYNPSQMQVILVKPDRFEDVTAIADHLNEKKTVVLNLESANREVSRRIIDFLSGVAYANHGNMRKVANSTFIIVPTSVDVMGELMLEDFEEGKMYF